MKEVERDGERVLVPGAWQLPTHTILPEKLEEARTAIARMLQPAGDAGVGQALMPLMLTQVMPNTEGMEDKTLQAFIAAKASEYQRHLRDIPLDILKSAADACARKSKFFPAVAELFEEAREEWEKRKLQSLRIETIIKNANAPKKAEPFNPGTPEERNRAAIKRYHKFKGGVLHDSLRRTAIEAEKWLAEHEGREADLEQFGTATPAITAPVMPRRSQHSGRKQAIDVEAVEVTRTPAPEPWQYGEPLYQKPPDEPPVPDEIPE